MAKYTEEQKAAVLSRIPELGVHAAAQEAGIPWQTVAKWNKAAAKETADEKKSEAKAAIDAADEENAAAVIEETQEKAEEVKEKASKAKSKIKEAGIAIAAKAEDIKDAASATEIEIKKKSSKASRKVKETKASIKATAEKTKKPVQKAKAIKMDIVFESSMGGQITPEEIAAKVPKGTDAAYVKMEENKIYWVKGTETGSVDIW